VKRILSQLLLYAALVAGALTGAVGALSAFYLSTALDAFGLTHADG